MRAVDAGVDGIHLSNHGGRQLDRTVATIDLVRPLRRGGGGPGRDRGRLGGAPRGRHCRCPGPGGGYVHDRPPLLVRPGRGRPRRRGHAIDLLVEQFRRTLQLLGVASVPELRQHADALVVRGMRPGGRRLYRRGSSGRAGPP